MSEGPGINSSDTNNSLARLEGLIRDGKLSSVDDAELARLLHFLCIARTGDSTNALHIVQGLALNHEQMARHITKLDAASRNTQCWFMALAVTSVIASGIQIVQNFKPSSPPVVQDSRPAVQDDAQKHQAPGGVHQPPSPPPLHE